MKNPGILNTLFIRLYTWFVTVFFGAILLDGQYARLLAETPAFSERSSVFAEVSDFLLLIGAMTVLTGLGAIGFSWSSNAARNLLIASLLFVIVFEFMLPAVFFPSLRDALGAEQLALGRWIRLPVSGLASLLAFVGLGMFYRQR